MPVISTAVTVIEVQAGLMSMTACVDSKSVLVLTYDYSSGRCEVSTASGVLGPWFTSQVSPESLGQGDMVRRFQVAAGHWLAHVGELSSTQKRPWNWMLVHDRWMAKIDADEVC
jgi:hypothetical protein